MNAQGCALVLLVAVMASVTLAVWKALGSERRHWDGGEWDEWDLRSDKKTFIGRLSWFAVPWPLFIAITILAGPYILAVVLSAL